MKIVNDSPQWLDLYSSIAIYAKLNFTSECLQNLMNVVRPVEYKIRYSEDKIDQIYVMPGQYD